MGRIMDYDELRLKCLESSINAVSESGKNAFSDNSRNHSVDEEEEKDLSDLSPGMHERYVSLLKSKFRIGEKSKGWEKQENE